MKKSRPQITVIGASNVDLVIKTARFPVPGETVFGENFLMVAGGKGANQAAAAAKLGARVYFVARVGKDVFGEKTVANLRAAGVETGCIIRAGRKPTGTALIIVDKRGENVIVVDPGANAELNKRDIDKNKRAVVSSDVLVLQLETPLPATEYALGLAGRHGVPVVLNPAPARGKLKPEMLRNVAVLTPNETELQALTGRKTGSLRAVREAAGSLRLRGVKTVVVTLGGKGALLVGEDWTGLVPARKVHAVDTTAAGDAFTGSLAFGIARGMALRAAAAFANGVAALSVTRTGAQTSLPSLEEVERFLKG